MTEEAETVARQNNMKKLYEISRTLSGKNVNTNTPVRDNQGKIISSDIGQRARWVEHFKEVLNRPPPPSTANIPTIMNELQIITGPPSRVEITEAIKTLKNGKAAGPDGIPPTPYVKYGTQKHSPSTPKQESLIQT